MKYDDEELAEAALLLASISSEELSSKMPRALEQKIIKGGRAITSEIRSSTTQAGVISLEALPEPSLPSLRRRSLAWVGWLAAAACIAIGVYRWRVASIESDLARTAASSEIELRPTLELSSADGVTKLTLLAKGENRGGRLQIVSLPTDLASQRLTLWVSRAGAETATPVGSFSCGGPNDVECSRRALDFTSEGIAIGEIRTAWVTKGDVPAQIREGEANVVARGERR